MTWNEPVRRWLLQQNDWFNAARLEVAHLAVSASQSSPLGRWWRGDTRCHWLIDWWLSWTEAPVSRLCENMLMQIDANHVVLYMQISHATSLRFLVLRAQITPWERERKGESVCRRSCLSIYVCVYVWCVCVFVWKVLPRACKCNQYSVSYKCNSTFWLHCVTHCWGRKPLLQGLRMQ